MWVTKSHGYMLYIEMKSYPVIWGYIMKMGNKSSSKASQCLNSKDFPVTGRGTKYVSNGYWKGVSLFQNWEHHGSKFFCFKGAMWKNFQSIIFVFQPWGKLFGVKM